MKEYSVYVLISHKDHKHYKGLSKNIPKRLSEHNSGKVRSTKSRRPFSLIYSERIGKLSEARKREKFLKSSTGSFTLNILSLPPADTLFADILTISIFRILIQSEQASHWYFLLELRINLFYDSGDWGGAIDQDSTFLGKHFEYDCQKSEYAFGK